MMKKFLRWLGLSAVLGAIAAVVALTVATARIGPERSLFFVREIAAPDHVWYVDPETGARRYMGSPAQARAVIEHVAVAVSPDELREIPSTPFAEKQANETTVRRKGKFIRDQKGRLWYVHEIAKRRELVPADILLMPFLLSRSRELSRDELKQIPVAGDSPSWLEVPDGYEADIIVGELTRPRVLGWDPAGRLVVSEHIERGRVTALVPDATGTFTKNVVLDGASHGTTHLTNAHGFAFLDGRIYVASEHVLESWPYDARSGRVNGEGKVLFEIPPGLGDFPGQGHRTRTLVAASDGKLYLSIGSSCDSCATLDPEAYATIKRFDADGKNVETVATGLRNTVFFVEDPARGVLWGNDMGRDDLGEELPPDELNAILPGKDYGWPHCYGNRLPVPGSNRPDACATTEAAMHEYRAHSAPLGLRIIPASFNPAWAGDMLVAFHGSTLRKLSVAGYTVARVDLDEAGRPLGQEDVITGFLQGENVPAGRPVDLLFGPDGTLYMTDDHAGVVHRIRKK